MSRLFRGIRSYFYDEVQDEAEDAYDEIKDRAETKARILAFHQYSKLQDVSDDIANIAFFDAFSVWLFVAIAGIFIFVTALLSDADHCEWYLWAGSCMVLVSIKIYVEHQIKTRLADASDLYCMDNEYNASYWKFKFYLTPLITPTLNLFFIILSFIALIISVIYKSPISHDELHDILSFENPSDEDKEGHTTDDDILRVVYEVYFCVMLLCSCLLLKLFLVNNALSHKYLRGYLSKAEKLLKMENYFRIILNQQELFVPNLKHYLLEIPVKPSYANKHQYDGTSHWYNFCLIGKELYLDSGFHANRAKHVENIREERNQKKMQQKRRAYQRSQRGLYEATPPESEEDEDLSDDSGSESDEKKKSEEIKQLKIKSFYKATECIRTHCDHVRRRDVQKNAQNRKTDANSSDIIGAGDDATTVSVTSTVAVAVGGKEDEEESDEQGSSLVPEVHVTLWTQDLLRYDTVTVWNEWIHKSSKILANNIYHILAKITSNKLNSYGANRDRYDGNMKFTLSDMIDLFAATSLMYEMDEKEREYMEKMGKKCFGRFDKMSGDGGLPLFELEQTLLYFLKEIVNKRAQFESFRDIAENVQLVATWILVFLISFLFLMLEFGWAEAISYAVTAGTTFLYFGNSFALRTMKGFSFVFLLEPFGIGDTIVIEDVRYTVEKLTVFSTIMKDDSGQLSVWNNSELLQKADAISNLSRTKQSSFKLSVKIPRKSADKKGLNALKQRLKKKLKKSNKKWLRKFSYSEVEMRIGESNEETVEIKLFIPSYVPHGDIKSWDETETMLYGLMIDSLAKK